MTDSNPIPVASTAEWQAEKRRRVLLDAMGIMPLVSHRDPAGALVADRRLAPAGSVMRDAAAHNREPSLQQATNARREQPSLNRQLPDQHARDRHIGPEPDRASPAPARAPQPTPAKDAAQTTPAAGAPVSFSLLICAAANYLWIETLPERLVTREQLSLTTAMARAIGGNGAELVYQQFDWPLSASRNVPSDLNTARQSLEAMLGRMRAEQASHGIILMGECPTVPDALTENALRIPATANMLAEPLLKSEAWAVLRTVLATG